MISKEKIAQMLLIGFQGTKLNPNDPIVKAILAHQIGGVILFASNIQNPMQLKQLTQQLRDYAAQALLSPFFIGIDYEGGTVDRLSPQSGFPETLSAADIGQMTHEQAKQQAERMADTLKQLGFNLNFAPVVDVSVNPDNPIISKRKRSFSNDPMKVAEYAAIFSKAYQARGIMCVFKHFPGHGSSVADTHVSFVDVTNTWQEYELEPYRQLLRHPDNHSMIMTSHVVHFGLDNAGYPASLSAAITKGLLRDELKFRGVIVTDDMQMRAVADHYSLNDAVTLAINAGADMLIFGNQLLPIPQDPQQIINMIYGAVMAGRISQSRIEEAYQLLIATNRLFTPY